MPRREHSIIKGMQQEHDRLIKMGRQQEVDFNAQIARLEGRIKQLEGQACLICGKDEPCELDRDTGKPDWPGSPCTFDPSPVDAARRFMAECDAAKRDAAKMRALAESRREMLATMLGWIPPNARDEHAVQVTRLVRDSIALTPAETQEESD